MKKVWQNQYDTKKPPWNYDGFDKDLEVFLEGQDKNKTIIDLGCGNGSQGYHIEKLGYTVTSTDIVNVLEYDVKNFIIDDALDSKLTKKYDIILDRGLIHNIFKLKNRHITHDKSCILLKVLSLYETRFNPAWATHSGPYRFTEKQLMKFFDSFGFECVNLKDTYFYSNIQPYLRGYFCVYEKEETK